MHERRRFGNWGEQLAAEYLQRQGYEILERNYSCLFGELDIVARDGGTLAFVEVKARRSLKFGRPAAAVTASKQVRLRKSAFFYLQRNRLRFRRIRFDVIEILDCNGNISLNHLKNCF